MMKKSVPGECYERIYREGNNSDSRKRLVSKIFQEDFYKNSDDKDTLRETLSKILDWDLENIRDLLFLIKVGKKFNGGNIDKFISSRDDLPTAQIPGDLYFFQRYNEGSKVLSMDRHGRCLIYHSKTETLEILEMDDVIDSNEKNKDVDLTSK